VHHLLHTHALPPRQKIRGWAGIAIEHLAGKLGARVRTLCAPRTLANHSCEGGNELWSCGYCERARQSLFLLRSETRRRWALMVIFRRCVCGGGVARRGRVMGAGRRTTVTEGAPRRVASSTLTARIASKGGQHRCGTSASKWRRADALRAQSFHACTSHYHRRTGSGEPGWRGRVGEGGRRRNRLGALGWQKGDIHTRASSYETGASRAISNSLPRCVKIMGDCRKIKISGR